MRSSRQNVSSLVVLSAILLTAVFSATASAAPAVPVISTPAADTLYSKTSVVSVGGTTTSGTTITVYDGGTMLIEGLAPSGTNWSFSPTLGPGLHILTAWAVHPTDGPSGASNQKAVIVDLTAPVVHATAPANGSTTSNAAPAFVFDWTEDMPSTLECRVDASPTWTACGSGNQLAVLADGGHPSTCA